MENCAEFKTSGGNCPFSFLPTRLLNYLHPSYITYLLPASLLTYLLTYLNSTYLPTPVYLPTHYLCLPRCTLPSYV